MRPDSFSNNIQILRQEFDDEVLSTLSTVARAKELWPFVYIILSDTISEAYIGESVNIISRIRNHLDNPARHNLETLFLIGGCELNKSATLDIESSLIKYMAADKIYKLQNGNNGLTEHQYFQKEKYRGIFTSIWQQLQKRNIAKNSIVDIENSDLFKYSPYKALSTDQYEASKYILQTLLNKSGKTVFIEGSAGTGKTILAVYLIKLLLTNVNDLYNADLNSDNAELVDLLTQVKIKYPSLKIGLVVPMQSLRATIKKVFADIKGLSARMVIGPSEVVKQKYDILLVDESHRLRKRQNITNFKTFDDNNKRLGFNDDGTELRWILKQSAFQVFFYDSRQSIRPSDVDREDFVKLKSKPNNHSYRLKSQLRLKAGGDYVQYVEHLFDSSVQERKKYRSNDYEFYLFESIRDLKNAIEEKEQQYKLCRIAAGYSWKWNSKKGNKHDIEIAGMKFFWNSQLKDWINSRNAGQEIGCIHTTQGYDLNYAGVIFGKEIDYDPVKKEIIIIAEEYQDRNGKASIQDPQELKRYIINIYTTLMLRGIHGTYVYAVNKELRNYFKKHIPYKKA